jgi:hypothetical protein
MAGPRGEDDVVRLAGLVLAGLVLSAIGVATFALRDPPDTAAHIARECRFIASVEAKRMVWHDEGGPVPFEIWRADDRTSGAARPDLERWSQQRLPWQTVLLRYLAPTDVAPINCGAAVKASGAPTIIKHNEGPTRQIDKLQYSRVTFFPDDRFALARETSCWLDDNGWDEESRVYIWRRDGETWTIISDTSSLAVYESPRFKPPMRCFQTPVY